MSYTPSETTLGSLQSFGLQVIGDFALKLLSTDCPPI